MSVTASMMALMRAEELGYARELQLERSFQQGNFDLLTEAARSALEQLRKYRCGRCISSTAPYPRRNSSTSLVSQSCDQLLIGEATANRRAEQAGKPLHRVATHVPVIEAERELANVAVKMLRADVVERPNDTALEDGKDALDAVRGHVVADVFAEAVIDAPLAVVEAVQRAIDSRFVGVQFRAPSPYAYARAGWPRARRHRFRRTRQSRRAWWDRCRKHRAAAEA